VRDHRAACRQVGAAAAATAAAQRTAGAPPPAAAAAARRAELRVHSRRMPLRVCRRRGGRSPHNKRWLAHSGCRGAAGLRRVAAPRCAAAQLPAAPAAALSEPLTSSSDGRPRLNRFIVCVSCFLCVRERPSRSQLSQQPPGAGVGQPAWWSGHTGAVSVVSRAAEARRWAATSAARRKRRRGCGFCFCPAPHADICVRGRCSACTTARALSAAVPRPAVAAQPIVFLARQGEK